MFDARVAFLFLLPGATAFMIHNTQRSLCLEDSAPAGAVQLMKCRLDSESQQWVWINHGMLMCVASSRCLSAQHTEPVLTRPCDGAEVNPAGLMWDCDKDRLISRNTSMLLSIEGRRLTLSQGGKHSRWRSLEEGDICQEKLRSRRASEFAEENMSEMTEEQKEYLRWFYRTEDGTMWTFVLLGLAFVCLLIGFLLLGMGAMASKNRRKIAKYKAAAVLAHKCELEELRGSSIGTPSPQRLLQGDGPSPSNGGMSELQAGNIMLTWKDGNTSCLYSDAATETELWVERELPAVEETPENVLAAEVEVQEGGER